MMGFFLLKRNEKASIVILRRNMLLRFHIPVAIKKKYQLVNRARALEITKLPENSNALTPLLQEKRFRKFSRLEKIGKESPHSTAVLVIHVLKSAESV